MIGFTRPHVWSNTASKSDSAPTWYCVSPSASTAEKPPADEQVGRGALAAVARDPGAAVVELAGGVAGDVAGRRDHRVGRAAGRCAEAQARRSRPQGSRAGGHAARLMSIPVPIRGQLLSLPCEDLRSPCMQAGYRDPDRARSSVPRRRGPRLWRVAANGFPQAATVRLPRVPGLLLLVSDDPRHAPRRAAAGEAVRARRSRRRSAASRRRTTTARASCATRSTTSSRARASSSTRRSASARSTRTGRRSAASSPTHRCGYYDFMKWERDQQEDDEFVPVVV